MSQTKNKKETASRLAEALSGRDELTCLQAFVVAGDLSAPPLAVGNTATELSVRITNCQLGLFRGEDGKRPVTPAADVSPELEQAIGEGVVLGRLPCAVAWALAARFGVKRSQVANAAEKLGMRFSQCQLGTF